MLRLALGTLLVGFNDEMRARGILLTGLRRSTASEVRACPPSTLLFRSMHLPNALFGIPLIGAPVQYLRASLMGFALYGLLCCSTCGLDTHLDVPAGHAGPQRFLALLPQLGANAAAARRRHIERQRMRAGLWSTLAAEC